VSLLPAVPHHRLPELKKNYIDTGKVRSTAATCRSIPPDAMRAAKPPLRSDQGQFWRLRDVMGANPNSSIWTAGADVTNLKMDVKHPRLRGKRKVQERVQTTSWKP